MGDAAVTVWMLVAYREGPVFIDGMDGASIDDALARGAWNWEGAEVVFLEAEAAR